MNAVVLTVVALVFGMPVKAVDVFPTMDECLAAAADVVGMEEVLVTDCAWVEIESEKWRMVFGEEI